MAHNGDSIGCTICGIVLGGHNEWKDDVVALAGPHWPDYFEAPPSLKAADEEIIRYAAEAHFHPGALSLLPEGEQVFLQCEYDEDRDPDDPEHVTTARMYVGIHAACQDIANRVMKTSRNARVRSAGELWLTLERRCTKVIHEDPRGSPINFVPSIPNFQPGQPVSVGFERYYVHELNIWRFEDYWDGWWNQDPIVIPDLTTQVISNLEPTSDASSRLPSKLTQFRGHIEALPQEIKDHICTMFQDGQISLECSYLMPQTMWKQVFFQIPFLWDLDAKAVHGKSGSDELEIRRWNWEKITRQVMSAPQPTPPTALEYSDKDVWDYKKVGLDVPGGFTNRRRIWQIVEDMYPNDVQH